MISKFILLQFSALRGELSAPVGPAGDSRGRITDRGRRGQEQFPVDSPKVGFGLN